MKKALLFVFLLTTLLCPAVMADENGITVETYVTEEVINNGDYSSQLINKIKQERNTIYNALNLTPEQICKKDEIEEQRYKALEPVLKKLCENKQKLKNCKNNKTELNSINKELNSVKKDIREISNNYDKKFKKILNSEQRSKYNMIRKLKHAELSKLNKKNKESSLKPFGVPITQAEYSKKQKEEHSLTKCFKRKK